mmetsp:Transcript_13287/g.20779  ORF Transcript_13287/g.20779 Transcript_13287/m.20779 type:complete len:88 (+) Transcript_13287:1368-1631(+)
MQNGLVLVGDPSDKKLVMMEKPVKPPIRKRVIKKSAFISARARSVAPGPAMMIQTIGPVKKKASKNVQAINSTFGSDGVLSKQQSNQ